MKEDKQLIHEIVVSRELFVGIYCYNVGASYAYNIAAYSAHIKVLVIRHSLRLGLLFNILNLCTF